jgi:hypothetical protein
LSKEKEKEYVVLIECETADKRWEPGDILKASDVNEEVLEIMLEMNCIDGSSQA